MVGTSASARNRCSEAQRAGVPFVDQRWLGGMLTNFKTVKTVHQAPEEPSKLVLIPSAKEQLTFKREKLEKTSAAFRIWPLLPDAIL
jgi:small subunit ribosomal protein S2